MLGSHKLMAFIATCDAMRSRAFYRDVLGLRLVEETEWALVFDAHGTTLRVQIVGELQRAPHTALGWEVPDIGRAVAQLRERGVVFEHYPALRQDAAGVWTTPDGSGVAWFKDPDGNVLSLTQTANG